MLNRKYLEQYFSQIYKEKIKILTIHKLKLKLNNIKEEGSSVPYMIEFDSNRGRRRLMLKMIYSIDHGINNIADRSSSLIWKFFAYKNLPRHSKSIGIGIVSKNGRFLPLSNILD